MTKNAQMAAVPVGAAGDLTVMKRDHVLQQIHHFALSELMDVTSKGFAAKVVFADFYLRYRVLLPHFFKGLLAEEDFTEASPTWRRPQFVSACEKLFERTKQLLRTSKDYASVDFLPNDLVLGKSCIFMREKLYLVLEDFRIKHIAATVKAATTIQSIFRMLKKRRKFHKWKRLCITIQAFIRCKLLKTTFKAKKRSSVILQSLARMLPAKQRFRKILKAVALIKKTFFGKMFARIRYRRLRRAARLLQNVAMGLCIRRFSRNVVLSAYKIQSSARSYLQRKKVSVLQKKAIILLQRVSRGFISRQRNVNIIRMLAFRRDQRTAQRVIRKLQAIWRR